MTQNIITYYIPQNLHITKGKIYNLYINKIKNLDLTEIINNKPNYKTPINKNNIIQINKEDYDEIMNLRDISLELYNKTQKIAKKLTNERNKK